MDDKGAGCARRKVYEKTFKTGAQHLVVRSAVASLRLRAGARLDVRLTLPGAVGRAVRYHVNRAALPDSEQRCLADGTGLPRVC